MATVVSQTKYTGGRGKGILGVQLSSESQRPGTTSKKKAEISKDAIRIESTENNISLKKLLVCYDYTANLNKPGGFTELTIKKGEMLEFLSQHTNNEYWWQARNSEGMTGYVPSSYVIVKEEQALPWLEMSALEMGEKERKQRALRHVQQQEFSKGIGFGPPPPKKEKPYVYVSAYNRPDITCTSSSSENFFCKVCDKKFNGPQPYKAHLASRMHKEEVKLKEEERSM